MDLKLTFYQKNDRINGSTITFVHYLEACVVKTILYRSSPDDAILMDVQRNIVMLRKDIERKASRHSVFYYDSLCFSTITCNFLKVGFTLSNC